MLCGLQNLRFSCEVGEGKSLRLGLGLELEGGWRQSFGERALGELDRPKGKSVRMGDCENEIYHWIFKGLLHSEPRKNVLSAYLKLDCWGKRKRCVRVAKNWI